MGDENNLVKLMWRVVMDPIYLLEIYNVYKLKQEHFDNIVITNIVFAVCL